MKIFDSYRRASCIGVALLFFTGCGSVAPLALQTASPGSAHAWVLPGATKGNLLYVRDRRAVEVLAYPDGTPAGKLRFHEGVHGICADAKGNVFITVSHLIFQGEIFEYAHGASKPTAVIRSRESGPNACAVDPTTGDLAVVVDFGSGPENIAVYTDASGVPTYFEDPEFYGYQSLVYDAAGNLFVDSYAEPNSLGELPKGATRFQNLKVPLKKGDRLGTMQWDGTNLAIQLLPIGAHATVIDRIAIDTSGGHTKARITGKTRLDGDSALFTWLFDNVAIGLEGADRSEIGLWHYPVGGAAFKALSGYEPRFLGAAVSVAP
jgi:hypothetical protein